MNMKKWSVGVMAAAMAFSLALPAGAAADPEAIQPLAYYDGTKESRHETVDAGNYTYDSYTTLYYGPSSKTCTWLVEDSRQDALVSLRTYLYSNNRLVEDTDWEDSTSYIHLLNTGNHSISGTLKADGDYIAYHDSSYNKKTTGSTPSVSYNYSGRAVAATETDNVITCYPVNDNGETYGSYLDRHTVGYAPDLISAVGENGIYGYVRLEDFAPSLESHAEVQIWQSKIDKDNMIPLYDLEGNVIGEYVMGTTQEQEEIDPAILADIYEITGGVMPMNLNEPVAPTYDPNAYPTNSQGLTYGSYADRTVYGYAPELVSVQGDENKSGYIHLNEFRAAEVGDSLTVYDLEGNTIDTFTIAGPGEVSEDQLAQIAQMER